MTRNKDSSALSGKHDAPSTANGHDIEPLSPSMTRAELLRLPAVLAILKVSRSTYYAGIKIGRFPAPVRLGPRTVAWRAHEIFEIVQNGVPK